MKNLMAEYSLLGPPQMPIKKYMGTSTISQKTKNKKRSSAIKTPRSAASIRRRRAKCMFVLS